MNKITVYVVAFLLSFTCLNVYSQGQNISGDSIFNHTVENGQTVYSIATMYGVTVEDIYKLNPSSRELIKSGEVLRIPQQKQPAINNNTPVTSDENYVYHTIQPKETLYSLTVKYSVPATSITEANPGLSVATFQIGKTIRIPVSRLEDIPQSEFRTVTKWINYTIPKRETLYNLSATYNIPADELIKINPELKDGVKEGMVIKVPIQTDEPVTASTPTAPRERDVNALLNRRPQIDRVNMVKVGILLPFMAENQVPSENTLRFVEYYEGLLLAVDSMKSLGTTIELSVFDTGSGTQKLNNILQNQLMKDINVIIGPVDNDQISLVSQFAKEHSIKHVIPFNSRNDDVLSNSEVFQVNTPQSYLYSKAIQAAVNLFSDHNIIILDTQVSDPKTEYIQALKAEFAQRNIAFRELVHQSATFDADIKAMLSTEKKNVIIPTSGTIEALNKFRNTLRGVIEQEPELNDKISLYGYPEWQTYVSECLEDFFALNTYIYSNFYADNLSQPVKDFYIKYRNWFSKMPVNRFPKYSILGFDTGMFFIEAIRKYGTNFENNLDKIKYNSLQTGFNFQRVNNWGGFINSNLFIIHYNKSDYSITRKEVK